MPFFDRSLTVCVSLFYVIDIGSTGSQGGAPWGVPVFTLHLDSDAGYADLPSTLLGAPVNLGEARPGGDVSVLAKAQTLLP